jgi:hypothetical protein
MFEGPATSALWATRLWLYKDGIKLGAERYAAEVEYEAGRGEFIDTEIENGTGSRAKGRRAKRL